MKSNLFSLILAPVVLAAAAVTAIPAVAATSTINVPFNFTVDGKALPAGEYTVQVDTLDNLVKFHGNNSPQTFIWTVRTADKASSTPVLNFDQQGGTHVLRSVQYGSLVTGQLDRKPGKIQDASATNIDRR
jgi:hypothetical protein